MQLRIINKHKISGKDSGNSQNSSQSSKKAPQPKAQPNDKDNNQSSNEANSNDSNEKDSRRRHQLRNSSSNYQGKYKKMNSGKYLYKLSSSDKKPPVAKKRQLKHIPNELTNQLKKLILHLFQKEDETLLNRKKKREEGKTIKKGDKPVRKQQQKPQMQMDTYQHNMTTMMPFHSFDYLQGNLFGNRSFQMAQHAMNGGFRFQNNGMFMINQGFPTPSNMNHYTIPFEQKEPFSSSLLDSHIKKGTTNHIVGAFYIRFAQQAKGKEATEMPKRVVKVSTVPIDETPEEKEVKANLTEKKEDPPLPPIEPTESMAPSPKKALWQQQPRQDEKNGANALQISTQSKENEDRIRSIINDPLLDVNIAGEQQLNEVNSIIKNIKEKKKTQITEKK